MLTNRKGKEPTDSNQLNTDITEEVNLENPIQINENDYLSTLPLEKLIEIIIRLNETDKKNLSFVSKTFNDIVNKFFFNTTYGDALRFKDWQEQCIQKLEEDVRKFKASHQITFFNRPHENAQARRSHYKNLLLLAYVALLIIAVIIKTERDFINDESKFYFRCGEALLGLSLFLVAGNIFLVRKLNQRATTRYHNTPMIQAHKDFTDRQALLTNDVTLNALQVNASTLLNVHNALDQALVTAKLNATKVNNYLLSQRTRQNKFNENDIKHLAAIGDNEKSNLGVYAGNTLGFWIQNVAPKIHQEIEARKRSAAKSEKKMG